MAFSPYKDNSPFIAKINLSEIFNDMIKNEEGYVMDLENYQILVL